MAASGRPSATLAIIVNRTILSKERERKIYSRFRLESRRFNRTIVVAPPRDLNIHGPFAYNWSPMWPPRVHSRLTTSRQSIRSICAPIARATIAYPPSVPREHALLSEFFHPCRLARIERERTRCCRRQMERKGLLDAADVRNEPATAISRARSVLRPPPRRGGARLPVSALTFVAVPLAWKVASGERGENGSVTCLAKSCLPFSLHTISLSLPLFISFSRSLSRFLARIEMLAYA